MTAGFTVAYYPFFSKSLVSVKCILIPVCYYCVGHLAVSHFYLLTIMQRIVAKNI